MKALKSEPKYLSLTLRAVMTWNSTVSSVLIEDTWIFRMEYNKQQLHLKACYTLPIHHLLSPFLTNWSWTTASLANGSRTIRSLFCIMTKIFLLKQNANFCKFSIRICLCNYLLPSKPAIKEHFICSTANLISHVAA